MSITTIHPFAYYDVSDKVIMASTGFAQQKNKYNDEGALVQTSYKDTKGELGDIPAGYAQMKMSYNKSGELVTKYYSASGAEVTVQ